MTDVLQDRNRGLGNVAVCDIFIVCYVCFECYSEEIIIIVAGRQISWHEIKPSEAS